MITHGVGPMRRYVLGALLLDLEDPQRVIGHLRAPLLEPDGTEREGYVPNVVYSCGGSSGDDSSCRTDCPTAPWASPLSRSPELLATLRVPPS